MPKAISSDSNQYFTALWDSLNTHFSKCPQDTNNPKRQSRPVKAILSLIGQKRAEGLQSFCCLNHVMELPACTSKTWTLRDSEKSAREVSCVQWGQMSEQQWGTHPHEHVEDVGAPDGLPAWGLQNLLQVLSYELLHLRGFAVSYKKFKTPHLCKEWKETPPDYWKMKVNTIEMFLYRL